jgi:hypothetical protein
MDIKETTFGYLRHFLTKDANLQFAGVLLKDRCRPGYFGGWKLTRSAGRAIAMASRQTSA